MTSAWRRIVHRAALACAVSLGVVTSALASPLVSGLSPEDTASLRVQITGSDTTSLDPSVVTLQSEQEPTRRWTTQASGPIRAGSASFATFASITGLPPGVYLVTVHPSGQSPLSMNVTLRAREIVTLVASFDDLPQKAAGIRIASRQTAGEGLSFDEAWLEDHPSGRNIWALVETAVPFVIADRMDTGGIGTGHSARMGSRGASWSSTSVTFGDMTLLSPNEVGLIPFAVDLGAVGAVSVTSGLAAVETQSPGVQIGLTPRRAGARRHGSLQLSFTTPGMVDTRRLVDAPPINRISTWRNVSGQMSGPAGDRSGLVVSGAITRAQFSERDLPGVWTSDQASLFSHLVVNATEENQIRVLSSVQRAVYPFGGRSQFLDRRVTERATFWQTGATWEHTGAGGSRAMISASFQRAAFTPGISVTGTGVIDRVLDGPVPRPASQTTSTQWELKAQTAAPLLMWGGTTHELRAGIDLRQAHATSDILALSTVAEQVGGLAARVWLPATVSAMSQRSLLRGTAYLGDRIGLGPTATLNAGVRADLEDGSARGASTGVRWSTMSPRANLQWNLGPLSLFGGAGLYAEGLTLGLLGHGDPGEAVSHIYRWIDSNADGRYDPSEQGVLVARAGRGAAVMSVDSALSTPRTFERTAGLELRHGQLMRLRAAAIWRNQSSLLGVVNTGVPASSYRAVLIPDAFFDWDGPADDQPLVAYDQRPESFGQDAFLLTNLDGDDATYQGVEVTWHLTTRRLVMLFGATAYRNHGRAPLPGFGPLQNDQSVSGDRFNQPNAVPVLPGRLFFDRAYVGKWSATYRAPGDIRVGFSARYQDGQPFSRVVVAPDLAQGPEMLHAYSIGRTRFTYTLTLDVRVEKELTIGGRRAAVHVDVFNATRHLNEVEEDVLTTPAFRRSTAMQPPLTVRVGFRIGM